MSETGINEESDALLAQARERDRPYRRERDIQHRWHVWINRRQQARSEAGEPWEHDLYEWKAAWEAMAGYLPIKLRQARTGTLPTVHRQCSRSAPEPIERPALDCALGQEVTSCPILVDLFATWREEAARDAEGGHPSDVSLDDADHVAARVCAWHIFTTTFRAHERGAGVPDTSEGYAQDTSDRMFWSNVYENLRRGDEDEGPAIADSDGR